MYNNELLTAINRAYWYVCGLDDVEAVFRKKYNEEIDELIERYGISLDTFMYFYSSKYPYAKRRYSSGNIIPVEVQDVPVTKEMYNAFVYNGVFNMEKIKAEMMLHRLGLSCLMEEQLKFSNQILTKDTEDVATILMPIFVGRASISAVDILPFTYKGGYLYVEGILYDMSSINEFNPVHVVQINSTSVLTENILFLLLDCGSRHMTGVLVPRLERLWCIKSEMSGRSVPVVRDKSTLRRILLRDV